MGLLSRKINFIIVLDLVMVFLSHDKYMWSNLWISVCGNVDTVLCYLLSPKIYGATVS